MNDKFLHMRIDADTKAKARECAHSVGLSMSAWIKQTIHNAINQHRATEAARQVRSRD